MASHPKQVRDSFSCQVRHGRSKAQMYLQKILNLISSSRAGPLPPPETPNQSSFHPQFSKLGAEEAEDDGTSCCANSGFNFDLNIKLGSPLEIDQTEDSGSPSVGEGEKTDSMTLSADVSTMTEKSSVGECDLQEKDVENFNRGDDSSRNKNGEESEAGVEDRTTESSEFANPRVRSSEIEINELSGGSGIETQEANNSLPELRSEGCLHMLIEAAKLISGEFVDHEPEPEPEPQAETNRPSDNNDETATAKQTKRGHCWTVGLCGDTSPVVRSKRGRSQALPCRYRDSVVEPLNRLSRHRSTSFSTRRRSR